MRELNKTGWLPYHKRKTVACFLCHDMEVDWRFGAFHFEEVLLDYDVAMNYGNWTFCARVDKPYGDRYSAMGYRDPEHQSSLKSIKVNAANDPNNEYIRRWVPELKEVPAEFIQCPWNMSNDEQQRAGCVIGSNYPAPVVHYPELQKEKPKTTVLESVATNPYYQVLERFFKFPAFASAFLLSTSAFNSLIFFACSPFDSALPASKISRSHGSQSAMSDKLQDGPVLRVFSTNCFRVLKSRPPL